MSNTYSVDKQELLELDAEDRQKHKTTLPEQLEKFTEFAKEVLNSPDFQQNLQETESRDRREFFVNYFQQGINLMYYGFNIPYTKSFAELIEYPHTVFGANTQIVKSINNENKLRKTSPDSAKQTMKDHISSVATSRVDGSWTDKTRSAMIDLLGKFKYGEEWNLNILQSQPELYRNIKDELLSYSYFTIWMETQFSLGEFGYSYIDPVTKKTKRIQISKEQIAIASAFRDRVMGKPTQSIEQDISITEYKEPIVVIQSQDDVEKRE